MDEGGRGRWDEMDKEREGGGNEGGGGVRRLEGGWGV